MTDAERAAADELTRELDTVYAEPTETAKVNQFLAALDSMSDDDIHVSLKRMLAAERAAIHARYEAVAAELAADSREYDAASERANWPESRARAGGMSGMALEAAARIRQVAAQ